MSIARCRTVVGSLYGLMRNALGLNVATPLESQELSCTVAPDRRLIVLGHEPIAGFTRDHSPVADEAAMLALHTLDGTSLLTEPTFVAPGDSVLRADDPGWRWHCIAGHGTALSDWERRPLAGALEGLAVTGHTQAIATVTGLQSALDGKQAASAHLTSLSAVASSAAGRNLLAVAAPAAAKLPQINADSSITLIDVPSGGGSLTVDPCVLGWQMREDGVGGVMSAQSVSVATALVSTLRDAGIYQHMLRLDVGLGANLIAGATPLIDRLGRGSVLVGMSEAHFSESVGITFSGTNYILSGYYPSDLGAGGNGGLGWWEGVAAEVGNVEPLGSSDGGANRFLLDLRSGAPGGFRWGNAANVTQPGPGRAAAHYYGQRSSATSRTLYRDGVCIASNTTSDAASGASAAQIAIGASNYAGTYYPWTGRCILAYLTDGTLTDAQVVALHTALADFVATVGR